MFPPVENPGASSTLRGTLSERGRGSPGLAGRISGALMSPSTKVETEEVRPSLHVSCGYKSTRGQPCLWPAGPPELLEPQPLGPGARAKAGVHTGRLEPADAGPPGRTGPQGLTGVSLGHPGTGRF